MQLARGMIHTLGMENSPLELQGINVMTEADFVATFGSLFEHSPWIARETWKLRPFTSRAHFLQSLLDTLRQSAREDQIKLIRAHPDLAGRLAATGELTEASGLEQASAGLDRLTPEEARLFNDYNEQYRAKFGFPFVVCARLTDKKNILKSFQQRLPQSLAQEMETALREIEKIATLRLEAIMPEEAACTRE
jgi:2-oxo-4-hydroxy-4-carboxy-5-ureidoimidazoline decarboxylase